MLCHFFSQLFKCFKYFYRQTDRQTACFCAKHQTPFSLNRRIANNSSLRKHIIQIEHSLIGMQPVFYSGQEGQHWSGGCRPRPTHYSSLLYMQQMGQRSSCIFPMTQWLIMSEFCHLWYCTKTFEWLGKKSMKNGNELNKNNKRSQIIKLRNSFEWPLTTVSLFVILSETIRLYSLFAVLLICINYIPTTNQIFFFCQF